MVASHPLRCEKGHDAVAVVWSDGRVEMACPICGRYELSGGAAERETEVPTTLAKEVSPTPPAEQAGAADLEDTQPLPVLSGVPAPTRRRRVRWVSLAVTALVLGFAGRLAWSSFFGPHPLFPLGEAWRKPGGEVWTKTETTGGATVTQAKAAQQARQSGSRQQQSNSNTIQQARQASAQQSKPVLKRPLARPPSQAQIEFILGHTYILDYCDIENGQEVRRIRSVSEVIQALGSPVGFEPIRAPVTVPDGHGGYLTAVIGYWRGGAEAGTQFVFFWHNDRYLGRDSNYSSCYPRVEPVGNRLAVTYPDRNWPEGMSYADFSLNADKIPGPTIYFWWDGQKLQHTPWPPGFFEGRRPATVRLVRDAW